MQPANPLQPSILHCVCPHCSSALEIPGEFAGVTAPCPSCGVPLTAPSLVNPPSPVSPPEQQGLPEEKRFNEPQAQPAFSDRIENPHIGVQTPSEEQQRNIENAPPLPSRPRPPRRKSQPAPQVPSPSQMTNEQLNAYAHPQQYQDPQQQVIQQGQVQPQAYQAAPMPTAPQASPSQASSRRRSGGSSGAISPTTGLSSSHEEKKEGQAVIKIFIAATLCLIVVAAIAMTMLTR